MTTFDAIERRGRTAVRVWVDEFAKHDVLTCASAVAFQVLKSLVPLTLLGLALLGALGREDVWTNTIAPEIQKRFDLPVYHAIDFGAKKIFANDTAPLIAFAALLTLWYVSGGVRAIMTGLNRIYEADETRSTWHRWLLSVGLAFCVVGGIVGAALLVEAVPKPNGGLQVPVLIGCWLGAIALLASAAGLLVRFAPAKRRPTRWASVGGLVVVVAWIVFSVVFRFYVSSVANFKTAIGQLTVFILLMVWVYASAIVFLVGVEIDDLLRKNADDKRGLVQVLLGRPR